MNLHSTIRYPFFKFIFEEMTGSFYENELTYLNRMLILYHNRYLFSIHDDVKTYLDSLQNHLTAQPNKYWYLNGAKRKRIKLIESRILYLIKENRSILDMLLERKDYSSPEAKKATIVKIYDWLKSTKTSPDRRPPIDIQYWIEDLQNQFGNPFISENAPNSPLAKACNKMTISPFYHILTGDNTPEKRKKFDRLVVTLVDCQWISEPSETGLCIFRKPAKGGRTQLAALYYCLNQRGHIARDLSSREIARMFNTWLSHDYEFNSFARIFQLEEQERFHCKAHDSVFKYVKSAEDILVRSNL